MAKQRYYSTLSPKTFDELARRLKADSPADLEPTPQSGLRARLVIAIFLLGVILLILPILISPVLFWVASEILRQSLLGAFLFGGWLLGVGWLIKNPPKGVPAIVRYLSLAVYPVLAYFLVATDDIRYLHAISALIVWDASSWRAVKIYQANGEFQQGQRIALLSASWGLALIGFVFAVIYALPHHYAQLIPFAIAVQQRNLMMFLFMGFWLLRSRSDRMLAQAEAYDSIT